MKGIIINAPYGSPPRVATSLDGSPFTFGLNGRALFWVNIGQNKTGEFLMFFAQGAAPIVGDSPELVIKIDKEFSGLYVFSPPAVFSPGLALGVSSTFGTFTPTASAALYRLSVQAHDDP